MDSTEPVPLALCSSVRPAWQPFHCSAEITSQAPISFLHWVRRVVTIAAITSLDRFQAQSTWEISVNM